MNITTSKALRWLGRWKMEFNKQRTLSEKHECCVRRDDQYKCALSILKTVDLYNNKKKKKQEWILDWTPNWSRFPIYWLYAHEIERRERQTTNDSDSYYDKNVDLKHLLNGWVRFHLKQPEWDRWWYWSIESEVELWSPLKCEMLSDHRVCVARCSRGLKHSLWMMLGMRTC